MANDYVAEKKNEEISFSRQWIARMCVDSSLCSRTSSLTESFLRDDTVDGRWRDIQKVSICFNFNFWKSRIV